MRSALALALFFTSCCRLTAQHICKPQGFLKLTQPYKQPRAQPALPFCSQYQQCTCCDATAVAMIYHSFRGTVDDASTTSGCRDFMVNMACRVCDPEVGVGLKPGLCSSTCSQWYRACHGDFFHWHAVSGQLLHCADGDEAPLCFKLGELAANGTGLCAKAGFAVTGHPCFDTSVPQSELCPPQSVGKPAAAAGAPRRRKAQQLLSLRWLQKRLEWVVWASGGIVVVYLAARWVQQGWALLQRQQQPTPRQAEPDGPAAVAGRGEGARPRRLGHGGRQPEERGRTFLAEQRRQNFGGRSGRFL